MALRILIFLVSVPAFGQTVEELCRQRVAERTCYVRRAPLYETTSECGVVPEFRQRILATYDAYPDYLKAVVCALDRIFIAGSGIPGTGLAKSWGHSNYEIFLNRAAFDADAKVPLSIRDFLQWKERRYFGDLTPLGAADNAPDKLRVIAEMDRPSSWLDYIFTHELGHVVDMATNVGALWERVPWDSAPGRWRRKFPTNSQLIAGSVFEMKDAKNLYSTLEEGATASLYGSCSAGEDFAESFAIYVLGRERGLSLRIQLPGEEAPAVDLVEHLESPAMAVKRDVLGKVVESLKETARVRFGR